MRAWNLLVSPEGGSLTDSVAEWFSVSFEAVLSCLTISLISSRRPHEGVTIGSVFYSLISTSSFDFSISIFCYYFYLKADYLVCLNSTPFELGFRGASVLTILFGFFYEEMEFSSFDFNCNPSTLLLVFGLRNLTFGTLPPSLTGRSSTSTHIFFVFVRGLQKPGRHSL